MSLFEVTIFISDFDAPPHHLYQTSTNWISTDGNPKMDGNVM